MTCKSVLTVSCERSDQGNPPHIYSMTYSSFPLTSCFRADFFPKKTKMILHRETQLKLKRGNKNENGCCISFEMLSTNALRGLVFQRQIGFPVSSHEIMKCLERKAA